MNDTIKDKKIESVTQTTSTEKIQSAQNVESVQKIQKASAVGSVQSISSKKSTTKELSAKERQELFNMIDQESKNLFKDLPEDKRKVIGEAVKMAIDSGIIDNELN